MSFPVAIIDDDVLEFTEDFIAEATLATSILGISINPAISVITILDNDGELFEIWSEVCLDLMKFIIINLIEHKLLKFV